MKSNIILVLVLSIFGLCHTGLFAQWTIGGESGFQINSAKVGGLTIFANRLTKSILTPYGRVTATYSASPTIGFRTGLGYSQKGFQIAKGLNVNIFNLPVGIGAKVATKADYIELPLEGIYTLKKGSSTFFFTAGSNIGYATGAKIIPKASFIIDIKLGETPIDLNDNIYNRWDVSGTAGVGFIKDTDNGKLIFHARYIRSMSNFLNNPIAGLKLKPYSYQLGIGYQTPIGRKRTSV